MELIPILLVITGAVSVAAQEPACPNIPTEVPVPPQNAILRAQPHTAAETIILIDGPSTYTVTCVGRVIRWEFFASVTNCDTIKFQIWRPQGGNEYRLIGENRFESSDARCTTVAHRILYPVPNAEQIPVRPGDVTGWSFETASGMLTYDNTFGGSNAYGLVRRAACVGTAVGNICTFANQLVRDYSVRSILSRDVPPVFDNLPLPVTVPPTEVRIEENINPGTLVFKVKASPRKAHNPATVNHELIYSMDSTAACLNIFTLDPQTGDVTIKAPIVRTDVPNNRICTLTFQAAIDTQGNTAADLPVTIKLNNLPHVFDPAVYSIPATIVIDTTATPGIVQRLVVGDPDYQNPTETRLQQTKSYYISHAEPDASIFSLDPSTPVNPHHIHNTGSLRCSADLTFWKGPLSYSLNITSSDQVHTAGPINIQVDITNLRKAPTFTIPPASDSVLESDTGTTQVGTAITYDADAESTYQMSPLRQYPLYETPKFRYQAATPTCTTTGQGCIIETIPNPNFDYDVTKEYFLEVEVTDTNMGYTDKANLTVEIIRVNKAPEFTVTGPLTATMPEEEPRHTPVPGIILKADDRDIKYGDSIFFRIESTPLTSNKENHFYTKNGSNLLYINTPIDIDPNKATEEALFHVRVYDEQGASHTTLGRIEVKITINDINDNAPEFSSTTGFVGSLPENTDYTHTPWGPFTATDRDAGNNAAIVYSIENNETGAAGDYYFHVDATSGELTVKHPIDYEQYHNISFKIKATDKGTPPLSSTLDVHFNIEDRNDNRPMFSKGLFNFEVPSNVPIHHTVGTVEAEDPDSAAVNNMTFFLLRPETDFYLSASSGHILTQSHLSTGKTYFLYLHARDNGILPGELLSDPAIVRIDSFSPGGHLLDIHLNLPMEEFDVSMEADFVAQLNQLLSPWIVKIWKRRGETDKTVVTLYVLEDNLTDDIANRGMKKHIVHRDTLLSILRENRQGSPSNALRGREFSKFHPVHVAPTHPDFATETAGGIATLVIVCLLGLLLLIIPIVLMKIYHVGPFKPSLLPTGRVTPKGAPEEEFKLGYGTEAEKKTPVALVVPPATSVLPSRQSIRLRPPPVAKA